MDRDDLRDAAGRLGILLSLEQADRMAAYGERVLQKNKEINLTAITDEEDFLVRHLLDSLTAAALPELAGETADVGTGGGFPGAIIKIFRPELSVTLIDATGKKLSAAAEICESLAIPVKTLHARAEEIGRARFRACFDSAVARAVAPLPALLEYLLPLVKPGGVAVAMKGPDAGREIAASRPALAALGGEILRVAGCTLPGGLVRNLVIVKKIRPTPERFPRAGKTILSSPIT